MTDAEREANERAAQHDLEIQIQDVQRRLTDWRLEWRGRKAPLEALAQREALADELRELRAQRQVRDTPESLHGLMKRTWDLVSRLEKDELPEMRKRLADIEEALLRNERGRMLGWVVAIGFRAATLAALGWIALSLAALVR